MKLSKILMIAGALLLLSLFVMPMWNITLQAPQYPEPIGMDIWINEIKDHNPNDIKNINLMNHYVGMKDIPTQIPEFEIFPKVVIAMTIIGLIFGFIGKRRLYLTWFAIMVILGTLGMYDFYSWEYEYGHDLKETAAIKFTDKDGHPITYQPPLIGSKMILNFKATSLPMTGAYCLFAGMILSVLAFYQDRKEEQNE